MRKFLILSVLVVAAACGGGGSDKLSKRDAITEVASAGCTKSVECGAIPADFFDACVTMGVDEWCAREGTDCALDTVVTVNELATFTDCVYGTACMDPEGVCGMIYL